MDGLESFEKALADDKIARERVKSLRHEDHIESREHKRHKHHRSSHRSRKERDRDGNDHRHKRSDCHREEEDQIVDSCKPTKPLESHEDIPMSDDERPTKKPKAVRDSWMEEGDVEAIYARNSVRSGPKAPPSKLDYSIKVSKNELNHHLEGLLSGRKYLEDIEPRPEVSYVFGDSGSQWRMTKLKAVYKVAEESGKSVDEVAIQQFGDLRAFDDVREEQIELERRRTYGSGYIGKDKPNGELFRERESDIVLHRETEPLLEETEALLAEESIQKQAIARTIVLDSTALNRMKARLMKAKFKKDPGVEELEREYNEATASFASHHLDPSIVILDKMESRMLAGNRAEAETLYSKQRRESGLVDSEDMSIEDMIREERRSKGAVGGEGMRAAERIARDAKFDTDLDYMDDNAYKLARSVRKSNLSLKNAAIGEFQKLDRVLDNCQLCHHEDKNEPPVAPIISLATRIYLTLPTEPELGDGGVVIVPIQHRFNLLECDDDEWEEIRNFMKSLTRMYHDQGRDVIFYENAAAPHRKMHAAMQVVPLPYNLGDTAPAFFKEAILSSDEEWTQHKKLIDTRARARDGLGKQSFRRSIAKEMPYFHVWFDIDGGLGHIVEDAHRWPKGDLFARGILGGMLDLGPDLINRQGRWSRSDKRLDGFKARWRKFDWTRLLTNE